MSKGWLVTIIVFGLSVSLTACRNVNVPVDKTTEASVGTKASSEGMETTEEGSLRQGEFTEAPESEKITELATEEETAEEQITEEQTEDQIEEDTAIVQEGSIPLHTDESAAWTGGIIQAAEIGKTILVDLNGDGIEEKLMVVLEEYVFRWAAENYYSYHPAILINDDYFTKETKNELIAEGPYRDYFYLMDLDTTDQWVEIALRQTGPSSDPRTTFFRYADGELVCIGAVPNVLWIEEDGTMDSVVLGDGKYTGSVRHNVIETAWAEKTWQLINGTEFNAVLEEAIPEYYEFSLYRTKEEWCEVVKEFPVYGEMKEGSDQIIILSVGTKLEFIRHYPEGRWLEIVYGEEEKTGWIKFEEEEAETVVMPGRISLWHHLHNYINGFNNAD